MTAHPLSARDFVRLSAVLGPARAYEVLRSDLRPDLAGVRAYAEQEVSAASFISEGAERWKNLADVVEWVGLQLERGGR